MRLQACSDREIATDVHRFLREKPTRGVRHISLARDVWQGIEGSSSNSEVFWSMYLVNLWTAFNAEVLESGTKSGRKGIPTEHGLLTGVRKAPPSTMGLWIRSKSPSAMGSWPAGRDIPGDRAKSAEAAPSRSLAIEPVENQKAMRV
jgi:hypothetical protein